MPSCNTYCLTWVSLILDLGYLFMATPAKCIHFSLPWTRYISSLPPFLTLTWSSSSSPFCAHAATTPWTCGICLDYSLEGLMLKLQLQYFVHLMQKTVSLEKILMLGRNEGQGEGNERGWDCWKVLGIWWTWVSASSGSWWWTRNPGVLQSMGLHTFGHNWTNEMNWLQYGECFEHMFLTCLKMEQKKIFR